MERVAPAFAEHPISLRKSCTRALLEPSRKLPELPAVVWRKIAQQVMMSEVDLRARARLSSLGRAWRQAFPCVESATMMHLDAAQCTTLTLTLTLTPMCAGWTRWMHCSLP